MNPTRTKKKVFWGVQEAGIERRAMITGDKEGENRKTGAVPSTIIAWCDVPHLSLH